MKGVENLRKNLYMFRHSLGLNQEQMAAKIGCSRATYSSIETGKRNGRVKFWEDLQKAFGLANTKLGELMEKEN